VPDIIRIDEKRHFQVPDIIQIVLFVVSSVIS